MNSNFLGVAAGLPLHQLLSFLVLIILALFNTVSCAPLDTSQSEAALRAGGKYEFNTTLEIPPVDEPAACGAQVLAAVIAAYHPQSPDASITLQQIIGELPAHATSERGMTPVEILLTARKHGLNAIIERGQWDNLLKKVADGTKTPIIMLDVAAEFPTLLNRVSLGKAMHWSIVSGYALDDSAILLAAPEHRHHVIKKSDFLKRWEKSDYCLIMIEAIQ